VANDERSWVARSVDDETYVRLAERLAPSELWSLLLDVMGRRAERREPAEVLRQYERDGFTRPAAIDQRTFVELDGHLLGAAAGFDAIELSPLAPLGACSAIGLASQNKIVSALRGTEVVSDPTNVLALECAARLRAGAPGTIRLATCHRCIRAQPFPKKPGFAPHFRIFCLASAGREQKDHAFVVDGLIEHIRTHLAGIDRLEQHGYAFPPRSVKLLATPGRAALLDRIARGISGIEVSRGVLEHRYYDGLRFMISVENEGSPIPFVDGGAFDWLAKLTSNRRMVFVASGMGAQLIPTLYKRAARR
jgi:hypothetical protein